MQFFPALLLLGARQTGKSTMIRQLATEMGLTYVSFDELKNLISVELDPLEFLNSLNKPLILDEVQRAPEIFLPIKVDIDSNRISGRYILTGSANPLLAPKLGDALTGRLAICNLWPLSQGELIGVEEGFFERLFGEKAWPNNFPSFDREELIKKLLVGGFPSLQSAPNDEMRKAWCNDYLALSLQKDINDLSKIDSLSHLPALLYALASRVGSTINLQELSRLAQTASTSVRRYTQLLENLFLLYRLPAWSINHDKRLAKSPKIHFSDTALLLHVLDMNHEQLQSNLHVLGHVVENFVVMECVKQATWSKFDPKLYHFRREGESGGEVDLVLESAGKIVGIEIKLSSIVRPDDIKGLLSLKESAGKAFQKGIVLYMGDKMLPLGEGLRAVPLPALWTG